MGTISAAEIIARAMVGATTGVKQGAEYLVAQQQAATGLKTGTLRGGIHVAEVTVGGTSVIARTATGGEAGEYAIFHHEGTGPHVIEASGGGLFWAGAAHPVRSVNHPGTRAFKFMEGPLIANATLLRTFISRAVAAQF